MTRIGTQPRTAPQPHAISQPPTTSPRRAMVMTALATLALGLLPTSAAHAADPIIVGAVATPQDLTTLTRAAGAPLAVHAYGQMSGSVPQGRMVNMKSTVTWPTVASAPPGSSTYGHIVRWAKEIKSRPGPVLFAFHHEPEAKTREGMGGSEAYKAAYRKVVDIFRAQGVRNVEYTWQMTSWAFATSTSDARYAQKWYPGSSYVDNVGVDPYNWYTCGAGQGRWEELKVVMDPALAFARAKGKKLVVAEFASHADPRRAQWIRNATQYFVANRNTVRAVFWFQYRATPGCDWMLLSANETNALGEMARNPAFTAG